MHKIVVAITGASGSIYARLLLDKLIAIREQWESLAIVMTANAKEVWKTELGNECLQPVRHRISTTNRILPHPSPPVPGAITP